MAECLLVGALSMTPKQGYKIPARFKGWKLCAVHLPPCLLLRVSQTVQTDLELGTFLLPLP